MDEGRPADRAVRRIIAVHDPVDGGEIGGAIGNAGAGRTVLLRHLLRTCDTRRRRRMRGQKIGLGDVRALTEEARAQGTVAAERRQEARRGIGIIARLGHHADTDLVGLQFLLAGETRERAPLNRLDLLALLPALDHCRRLADERGALFLFLAERGMARRDVADLVRHDGGNLGGIIGQSQKAARDIDPVRRHGESIDHRRIEDRHLIGLLGIVARLRQFEQNSIHKLLGRRVVIFAAEQRDHLLIFGRGWCLDPERARRRGRNLDLDRLFALLLDFRASTKRQGQRQREQAPAGDGGFARQAEH